MQEFRKGLLRKRKHMLLICFWDCTILHLNNRFLPNSKILTNFVPVSAVGFRVIAAPMGTQPDDDTPMRKRKACEALLDRNATIIVALTGG